MQWSPSLFFFYVQSIESAEIECRSQFVSESLHLVPNFAIFENKVSNIFFPVVGSSKLWFAFFIIVFKDQILDWTFC